MVASPNQGNRKSKIQNALRRAEMQIVGAHHVALVTSNFAKLREFYVETLGLPLVGGFPGRNILFIDIGGTTIELLDRAEQPAVGGGFDHLAFEVADVDAVYA